MSPAHVTGAQIFGELRPRKPEISLAKYEIGTLSFFYELKVSVEGA